MLGSLARTIIDAGATFRVAPDDLLDGTLPELGDTRAKASAFWMLLACSSVIAAAGVVSNSTAVIIGAMVIAPLGTPIYGVAAALVTGRNVMPVLLRLVGGCALAIGIGLAVDLLTLERIAASANPQVLSRTSPSLIDLLVAFATGLAGSMALVRTDISPALPGVAIAISLVPPLTVVGITAANGLWSLAGGALLLFLTNMFAIILAGLIVFSGARITTDGGPPPRRSLRARATLWAGVTTVVAMLAFGSYQAWVLLRDERAVQRAASAWAAQDDDWQLQSVQTSGDDVVVQFIGNGEVPELGSTARGRRLLDLDRDGVSLVLQFDEGDRIVV